VDIAATQGGQLRGAKSYLDGQVQHGVIAAASSFAAVRTVLGWNCDDSDIDARPPLLWTYLGHVSPKNSVEVGIVGGQFLAEADSGHREQSNERAYRRRPQWRLERFSLAEEGRKILAGIEVGHCSSATPW
jgi:hypothetical protein